MKKIGIFTGKIILIGIGAGVIFFLELAARIYLPDNRLNKLEAVYQVCAQDKELLWRQRAGLNTVFEGKPLRTNKLGLRGAQIPSKEEGEIRIICLGDSSVFGWGVREEETFSFQLERMLHNFGVKARVINAGQIGYSSFQGKKFLRQIFALSPDIVTVSYLLNDVDRCRFFRNEGCQDEELGASSFLLTPVKNFCSRSRVYFLLKRIAGILVCRNHAWLAKQFKIRYELSCRRVPDDAYRNNLEEIVIACRQRKIKPILIKMPVNLSLPVLSPKEESLLKIRPLSGYYYEAANKAEKEGNYSCAMENFKRALDYQVLECRKDAVGCWKIIEELTARQRVLLVDAAEALKEQSSFNVPYDPIHPSPQGHRLIAAGLCEVLVKEFDKNDVAKY